MAQETESVVRTAGLTKVFRDFWLREKVAAVRDLDLRIGSGEVYGLLGPNGSGKSTTLKMILGLMFPTGGQVAVFGRRPTDVKIKSRIGFLPEESYLYPFLDAHETLDYYGRLFGLPRRQRRGRTDMLLDMVGLRGDAYRRIGEYSKGMQRKIGMAQALINDPDLLILDEPTSGMDPMAARQFKDLIAELSRRGKTVILCSHLLADMEDVCDRVGILYAGQLRQEGTLGDLLARGNLTQITTEHLPAPLAERVRALLAEADKQVLAVEAPKERLEALFLRIVREAQVPLDRPAAATGEVAAFLRAGRQQPGRRVIEDLMAPEPAPEPAPSPEAEPAPPAKPEPAREVLEELTGATQQTAAAADPAPAPPARSAPPQDRADRGVIDDLVQPDETQEPPTDA